MSNPLIGTLIAVSAATPATVDSAGFGALSWTTVNGVITWGSHGDQSNDIPIPQLAGRILHRNGGVDGGEIPFTTMHVASDAGQGILRSNANGSTTVSVRRTEPDGQIVYYHGVIANFRANEATNQTYKGNSGVVRVNSAVVIV
jgi:hypothetical protein